MSCVWPTHRSHICSYLCLTNDNTDHVVQRTGAWLGHPQVLFTFAPLCCSLSYKEHISGKCVPICSLTIHMMEAAAGEQIEYKKVQLCASPVLQGKMFPGCWIFSTYIIHLAYRIISSWNASYQRWTILLYLLKWTHLSISLDAPVAAIKKIAKPHEDVLKMTPSDQLACMAESSFC